jgi:hypothetical protein
VRWSIFDILRGAIFWQSPLCRASNRTRNQAGNYEYCLTSVAKFDMFRRFAQKRRSMLERPGFPRNQVRGHPDEIPEISIHGLA